MGDREEHKKGDTNAGVAGSGGGIVGHAIRAELTHTVGVKLGARGAAAGGSGGGGKNAAGIGAKVDTAIRQGSELVGDGLVAGCHVAEASSGVVIS